MISKDDIKKLATLARIKLTSHEEEKFAKEIGAILGYIETIQSVSGTSEGVQVGENHNVFREDKEPHESGMYTKDLLAEAPKSEKDYVVVKKILS